MHFQHYICEKRPALADAATDPETPTSTPIVAFTPAPAPAPAP